MSADQLSPTIEGVFMRYFKIERERAEDLAEWFASSAWGNPTNYFQPADDIRQLVKLRDAFCSIDQFHRDCNIGVGDLIHQTLLQCDLAENPAAQNGDLGDWNPKHLRAWGAAINSLAAWKTAVDAAIREIEVSPRTVRSRSRVNTEAINIVDRGRMLWENETGSSAPAKGLNMATTFGRYLGELLLACECEADPRSAFNAWRKHLSAPVHTEGETN